MGARHPRRAGRGLLGALAASAGALAVVGTASPAHAATHALTTPAPALRSAVVRSARTSARSCAPGPVPTTTTTTTTTTTSTTTSTIAGGTTTSVAPGGSTTTTTPTTTTSPTTTTVPLTTPGQSAAYDLVTSNGGVHSYAGAQFYGSKASARLASPVVAAAATLDGGGYWLVTEKGTVYNFGDAANFGSPKNVSSPVVSITATPDGGGYWIATRSGNVYNLGDAAFCGSPVHEKIPGGIAGFAAMPDGEGYWLVEARGGVLDYGDAAFFGSAVHRRLSRPVIGIGATPDGGGYVIGTASGNVFVYGDAHFYGSPVHIKVARPAAAFAVTFDAGGYWFATARGRLYKYGDATFKGSLVHTPPKAPLVVSAVIPTISIARSTVAQFPHGISGYDISNYQCKSKGSTLASAKLPAVSALSVIEVAGWLDNADNSCLAAEVAWANSAQAAAGPNSAPYNLYLFLNSPENTSSAAATYATGPRGTCATLPAGDRPSCDAYNYGYNGAKNALAWALKQGAHSGLWWVDIENDSLSGTDFSDLSAGRYWSHSTALNDLTIQGAIDALRQSGALVGMYSTSVQYPKIAGDFVPTGQQMPLWVAGAPWTNPPYANPKGTTLPPQSVLTTWCSGIAKYSGTKTTDVFANGVPWILQETPGTITSPYNLDPDYAC